MVEKTEGRRPAEGTPNQPVITMPYHSELAAELDGYLRDVGTPAELLETAANLAGGTPDKVVLVFSTHEDRLLGRELFVRLVEKLAIKAEEMPATKMGNTRADWRRTQFHFQTIDDEASRTRGLAGDSTRMIDPRALDRVLHRLIRETLA